jgi:hypothetical protein
VQFRIETGLVHQLRQPLTLGQGRPGGDGHGPSLGKGVSCRHSWACGQGRNGASRAKRRGRSTKKHPPVAGA